MQMTTRGRYAVTAMLDLALHDDRGPVSLAEISRRQDISLAYLEQLFAKLRRAELVHSVRGPGGGYELDRELDSIYVAEIIGAVDESVDTTRCQGSGDCQGGETCLTHYLWEDLSEQILGFLQGVSLADLVSRRDVRRIAGHQDRKLVAGDMSEMRISATSV
ncbi:MAG: Fe-S cluster assembly transcriptional regulator IscR [Gammaproteobacteria bacterium]|nr:Fe-S cluster assembly transcriptional regulator IscR [Gammaproteobacteria bacterium]